MIKSFLSAAALFALTTAVQAHEGHSAAELPFGLDPTHLHLLTNHSPIFITLSGLIALALAMIWKNDVAKRVALLLLLIGTVGGLATYWMGQQAYKPVRGMADEAGQDWLDLHMERAEKVIWIYWLAAISAAGALVAVWRRFRYALLATVIAGTMGAASLFVSGWIADAGGKIRHPEIRSDSKPVPDESDVSDDPGTAAEAPHKH